MTNATKRKQKYQGILFDCDGTLVDSEWLFSSLLAKRIRDIGYPEFSDEKFRIFFKGYNYDYIRLWLINNLKDFPIEKFELQLFPVAVNESAKLKEIPGAKKLLSNLIDYPKCIVSSGHLHVVNYSLEVTQLKQYFKDDAIFTCELVKHTKPAPDLYLLACKKMNFVPADCIVVEDSLVGITAAIAAGLRAIGIIPHPEDEMLAQQMQSLGAYTIIRSLTELEDIFYE